MKIPNCYPGKCIIKYRTIYLNPNVSAEIIPNDPAMRYKYNIDVSGHYVARFYIIYDQKKCLYGYVLL
jgi:hypothetical protein